MSTRQVLRLPEVCKKIGLSKVTIWRMMRAGEFPQSIELGPNSVGWDEKVIDDWIANRPMRQSLKASA